MVLGALYRRRLWFRRPVRLFARCRTSLPRKCAIGRLPTTVDAICLGVCCSHRTVTQEGRISPEEEGSLCRSTVSSLRSTCLLYTSDAADDLLCVDLGGR